MTNFWPHCAYKTLAVGTDNQLLVTDEFLRTYLLRPELNLVPESCNAERALHQRLSENPRTAITEEDITAMADPDIQVNYQVWLR